MLISKSCSGEPLFVFYLFTKIRSYEGRTSHQSYSTHRRPAYRCNYHVEFDREGINEECESRISRI